MAPTPFIYLLPRQEMSTRRELSFQALSNDSGWSNETNESSQESAPLRKGREIFANAAALQMCEAVKLLIPCLIFMNFHTSGI